MEPTIRKYPRTRHIRGSRFQHGDHDMEAVPFEDLVGKHLVIEEKMDGANCGISFTDDGDLLLQSRGHYLRGGAREKHFALLKQWAASKQDELSGVLGSRYVMYGEWLFAKHTYFYDALPHYFMEFDVLDTYEGVFLDTVQRKALLAPCAVTSVLVLHDGVVASVKALAKMVTRSNFITNERIPNFLDAASEAGVLPKTSAFGNKEIQEVLATCDQSPDMEGLYLKWEEDGIVKGRYKYVRQSFTNSILNQEEHWHDRPIIQNRLAGGMEAMFR